MPRQTRPRTLTRVSDTRKDVLVATPVTLDGVPATISGRLLQFPSVTQHTPTGTGLRLVYAWETVDRIVRTQAGRFRS